MRIKYYSLSDLCGRGKPRPMARMEQSRAGQAPPLRAIEGRLHLDLGLGLADSPETQALAQALGAIEAEDIEAHGFAGSGAFGQQTFNQAGSNAGGSRPGE